MASSKPPGLRRQRVRSSAVQGSFLWWRRYSITALSNEVTTSSIQLLNTWNVATVTEKLNVKLYFILINLHENSHTGGVVPYWPVWLWVVFTVQIQKRLNYYWSSSLNLLLFPIGTHFHTWKFQDFLDFTTNFHWVHLAYCWRCLLSPQMQTSLNTLCSSSNFILL